MPLLQAALNGDRDHPAVPRTPDELAAEGRAAVEAGARVLHLHAYDDDGLQTFDAEPCAAAIRAVRAACPGIPISLSTSAEIEPDPERRRAMVEPLGEAIDAALAEAAAIEEVLTTANIPLEQVHHGDGLASWAVNRRGAARGHGIRTGLEDTPVLPDGREASGNGELVAAAAQLLGGSDPLTI
ncbi:MAG TPA: 3-keto-5-aminohexanoate cleavage protein [Thermoleophilaceae bacterium]